MDAREHVTQQYDLPSWIVVVLGLVLGGSGVAYIGMNPEPPVVWVAEFVVVGFPMVGVVYGGHWMGSHQLPARFRWHVVKWVVVGAMSTGIAMSGYLVGQSFEAVPATELGFMVLLVALYGAFVSLSTAVSNGRRHLPTPADSCETSADSSRRNSTDTHWRVPDERDVVVEHQYDWASTTPSTAIVSAVAIIENTEPTEIDLTLYEHIDPDSLNTIVTNETRLVVHFPLGEYWVLIDDNILTILRNPVCVH